MTTQGYVQGLALEYMKEHGLIERGWTVGFNRRRNSLGLCRHDVKRIEFSAILIPGVSDSDVLNTVLHEIAHAMVGDGHGHNSIWRRQFVAIGGNGQRLTRSVAAEHIQSIAKYKVYCGAGEYLGTTNRKTKRLTNALCKTHHKPIVLVPNS